MKLEMNGTRSSMTFDLIVVIMYLERKKLTFYGQFFKEIAQLDNIG